MPRKRLGEILLERKVIAPAQLEQALSYQRQTGHRLGAALVALGLLSEAQLCDALAQALGLKAVKMPPADLDWTALHSLRSRFCEANDLFPLSVDTTNPARKLMVVAMADPLNIPAIEEIEFTTGFKVQPVIAPLSGIRAAIRRYYLKETRPPSTDRMTVLRAGGTEDEVLDNPKAVATPTPAGARPGTPPKRDYNPRTPLPRPAPRQQVVPPQAHQHHQPQPPALPIRTPVEDDLPLLQGDELEEQPRAEVTERTALADLIRARAEKQRKKAAAQNRSVDEDLDYLFGVKTETPSNQIAKLESRFWALLRIMAKKGLITREEFSKELADKEDE